MMMSKKYLVEIVLFFGLFVFIGIAHADNETCVRLVIDKQTLVLVERYTWKGTSPCGLTQKESEEGFLKENQDMVSITDPVKIKEVLSSITTTVKADLNGTYTTYRKQKVNITFDPTPILTEEQKAKQELKAYILSVFPKLTDVKDLTVLMVKNSTLAPSIKGILYKAIMDVNLK